MKKLNKIIFVALAVIGLASCGSTPAGTSSKTPTTTSQASDVTAIKVNSDKQTIYVGDTVNFTYELTPSTSKSVPTWKSSNSSIMSITQNGVATALKEGSTTISAEIGKVKGKYTVIVNKYVEQTGITVAKDNVSIGKDYGFSYIDAKILPEDATNKEVSYSVSGDDVVTIDNKNGIIRAKNTTGTATVKVSSVHNPSLFKNVTVNVTDTTFYGNETYKVTSDITSSFTLQDVKQSMSLDAMPVDKCDDIDLLVILADFTDYPWDNESGTKMLNDVNTMFNGLSAEDPTTGVWESVASFYNKSSYGKLNLNFHVSNTIYHTGRAAKDQTSGNGLSAVIAKEAFTEYKTNNKTDGKEFDKDGNGIIDGVYIIYSAPDYQKNPDLNNQLFWAYVSWTGASANIEQPVINHYMWASYDFIYESGKNKIDAHTFIHETGHMMGADDYYNYNTSSKQMPMGGIDMMDMNIGDHNTWTKMEYGWVKPIYVNGNARVTIKSSQVQGDCIIINDSWNGTPFDEMIVLELSTPTGLNWKDATYNLTSGRPKVYTAPGVKMMHVDARLMSGLSSSSPYYDHPKTSKMSTPHDIGAANTDSNKDLRNYTKELYYQIGVIQKGKEATMQTQGAYGDKSDLFVTGDYFRMDDYNDFFYHDEPKFNNGAKLGYEIYFESVTQEEATIVIQKIA